MCRKSGRRRINASIQIIKISISLTETLLTPLHQVTFENIVTKRKIAHNEQILLFVKIFSILVNTFIFEGFPYFCPSVFNAICFGFLLCMQKLNHICHVVQKPLT